MLLKVEMANTTNPPAYRPPKEVLDIFWTLADGTDEQRSAGTVKLAKLIEESKDEDKENVAAYCRDRLVKGLSSGRKFARVGFSVALAQLLRGQYFQTSDVVTAIQEKLKPQRHEKSSKSEVGGIYLGRAFGFSSVVQSGRLSDMGGERLASMTEELFSMADKKSYLKAVCNKIVEDMVLQVSPDQFGDHIWPKLRDTMKQGWEACTLDKLSLLLSCRKKFPDIVKKKFLKKHWGFPVLNEENDDKLLKVTLDTVQRRELLLDIIIPSATAEGRDILSIWNGIGDKLVEQLPEKKAEAMAQRQLLGVKVASKLLQGASTQEMLAVILSPKVAHLVFHTITRKQDPLASAADQLFEQVCSHLKADSESSSDPATVLAVVEKLWKLEDSLSGEQQKGMARVNLVNSGNFTKLLDMMNEGEVETYANTLMNMVKGKDKWQVMSSHPGKHVKQTESCLRQLQHLATSPTLTLTHDLQARVLALFLRLAYFTVDRKAKAIQHCETCVNFEEDSVMQKLCESLVLRSLNSISTLKTGHQKRSDKESHFLELLFSLCQYIQELLSSDSVKPVKEWSDEMQEEWNKMLKAVCKMKELQPADAGVKDRNSAFLLLLMYLGFQVLADYKTASELLQDVYVCIERATSGEKKGKKENSGEPGWVEVLTEVLLHLMSLQSHLGRVVTANTFRLLAHHMTPQAVGLITEVLIPKKSRGDDAGGVMVEGDADESDDDDEMDDDVSIASSEEEEDDGDDKEDDEEDEDMAEEDEEDVEVDEKFRESVKQALGQAADVGDSDDEEKELSDLSDSEMFKLDDMLAEVFRQRRKAASGKKAREEKKSELANFRLRVLDLVENMIKSDRCGDFLLDVLKPLLLLAMRTNTSENQALCGRAQALFTLLRSKAKGLKDTVHTTEQQKQFFQELLELAQKTSDSTHMQTVSMACYIVMNISCGSEEDNASNGCMELFQETLSNIISKKQTKPHFSFFKSIIEINPVLFQSFSKALLSNLKDEAVKVHNKTLCCSILTSLCKKVDSAEAEGVKQTMKWMAEAGSVTSEILAGMERDTIKAMYMRELLQLMMVLQARQDILIESPYGVSEKQKLAELKSKFNTDLRRLANKVIAGIDRAQKQQNGTTKKNKKRKLSESEADLPLTKKSKQNA